MSAAADTKGVPTLAELAEDAAAYTPLWPGIKRVDEPRFCLLFLEWLTFVARVRLEPEEVEPVLAHVREQLRARRRSRAMWWIGAGSRPRDLMERLLELGLSRYSDEPLLGMAIESTPRADSKIVVKRVGSIDDYLTALRIEHDVNDTVEEARAVTRREAAAHWRQLNGSPLRLYLAYMDGRPVAMARAAIGDAVFLMGGATLPEARGRGAYTALVTARWKDGRGRPLVAQAGPDSRPILGWLGFQEVGEIHILVDELPQ